MNVLFGMDITMDNAWILQPVNLNFRRNKIWRYNEIYLKSMDFESRLSFSALVDSFGF